MKSHITVILDNNTKNISVALEEALVPHRLDWECNESIENHHWDYWVFPTNFSDKNEMDDPELKNRFQNEDIEILTNACFVRNLPNDYNTSGIIDLAGNWIDLQDFGWTMLGEPSKANIEARKRWELKLKEILNANKSKICVQVILHN